MLVADAAQGDTIVHVNNTTNLSVGLWVLITEASGAKWQSDPANARSGGQVWGAADAFNTSGAPATGRAVSVLPTTATLATSYRALTLISLRLEGRLPTRRGPCLTARLAKSIR